jgi:hypothetical protein
MWISNIKSKVIGFFILLILSILVILLILWKFREKASIPIIVNPLVILLVSFLVYMFHDKIQSIIVEFLKNRNSNKEPSKFKLYLISKFKKYIYPIWFGYEYGKLWLVDFLWDNSSIFRFLCRIMYIFHDRYLFTWMDHEKIYYRVLLNLYLSFDTYLLTLAWFYDLYLLQWYHWFIVLAISFFVRRIRRIMRMMANKYNSRAVEV